MAKKKPKQKPKNKPKQYCLTDNDFIDIDPEDMPIMYSILLAFRELEDRPTFH